MLYNIQCYTKKLVKSYKHVFVILFKVNPQAINIINESNNVLIFKESDPTLLIKKINTKCVNIKKLNFFHHKICTLLSMDLKNIFFTSFVFFLPIYFLYYYDVYNLLIDHTLTNDNIHIFLF
jgi:hypothetical protein